jgi:hypothetical protein
MRLYLFEHCFLCFRVRMMAALKRLHLQETVVLDDDSETMIRLVGEAWGLGNRKPTFYRPPKGECGDSGPGALP